MFTESRHARDYCRRVASTYTPLDIENGQAEGVAQILKMERSGESELSHLLQGARDRIRESARSETRDRLRCLEYARRRQEAVWDHQGDSRLDLREMLPKLTSSQLEAVWRYAWKGQSWKEAGEAMGVSPKTAASHYSHALTKLRGLLGA